MGAAVVGRAADNGLPQMLYGKDDKRLALLPGRRPGGRARTGAAAGGGATALLPAVISSLEDRAGVNWPGSFPFFGKVAVRRKLYPVSGTFQAFSCL